MKKTDENIIWPPKDQGGRPRHFNTAKKLQERIDEYFNVGVAKRSFIVGVEPYTREVVVNVPTISGLALFLGFCSRQSLYDYEKEGGFSYNIKKARLRIEESYEMNLNVPGGNVTGSIFALKNLSWSDKQEHEHTGKAGGAPILISLGAGIDPKEKEDV